MDTVYCTILSKGRLYQAIALFCSLNTVMKDFHLYTLCVDDDTYHLLRRMNLKNITVIHIKYLEDKSLKLLRAQRKLNEFCWTLKPIFIEKIFKKYPHLDRVVYIDADLYFFRDPGVIFRNQPDCSVLLTRGDVVVPSIKPELASLMQELTGSYNSGFISFKNDKAGRACLKWWKDRCVKDCSDTVKIGTFGDQKYLDEMPGLFRNVCEISTPGVNIGHWNCGGFILHFFNGKWFANQSELICYHFGGFRIVSQNEIIQIYEMNRTDLPLIYPVYKELLKQIIAAIEIIEPGFDGFATKEDLSIGKIDIDSLKMQR